MTGVTHWVKGIKCSVLVPMERLFSARNEGKVVGSVREWIALRAMLSWLGDGGGFGEVDDARRIPVSSKVSLIAVIRGSVARPSCAAS